MLNKELLIIALVLILGLSAIILLQNHEQITDQVDNGSYDQTSQENPYQDKNKASSS